MTVSDENTKAITVTSGKTPRVMIEEMIEHGKFKCLIAMISEGSDLLEEVNERISKIRRLYISVLK